MFEPAASLICLDLGDDASSRKENLIMYVWICVTAAEGWGIKGGKIM